MSSFLFSSLRQGAQYAALPSMVSGCMLAAHTASHSYDETSPPRTKCEVAAPSSPVMHEKHQTSRSYLLRRRMTAVGRFSLLSESRSNPSIPVIILAMSGKPLTATQFSDLYRSRKLGDKHDRFRSVTTDAKHFSLIPASDFVPPVRESLAYPLIYRNELKTWISDALLEPMDLSRSLWQAKTATGGFVGQSGAVQIDSSKTSDEESSSLPMERRDQLMESNVESLILFRAHHCMADGVSLGALFVDLMDEQQELQELLSGKIGEFKRKRKKKSWLQKLLVMVYYWGWGSIKTFAYQLYLYSTNLTTTLLRSNPWKKLQQAYDARKSDPDGQQEAKRTLSWVDVCPVDEVKQVADYFSTKRSKVTINDIFCSCVSAAIARLIQYHQTQHPELKLSLPYMNLVMPVHMFGGVLLPGHSIGNKIGAMVSRVPGKRDEANAVMDPKGRLLEVHSTLYNLKMTPTATWSYLLAKFAGTVCFGSAGSSGPDGGTPNDGILPLLFEKSHANASVVVSNVRGPETHVHVDGRRVESILGFLPLPPGIPLGMVIQSYANQLTLTVMAEPWAVPDAMGDLFLSWVVEEYDALRNQAGINNTSDQTMERQAFC